MDSRALPSLPGADDGGDDFAAKKKALIEELEQLREELRTSTASERKLEQDRGDGQRRQSPVAPDPVPVGINVQTKGDIYLSHTDRFTGSYIVGKMGMGKSTLIQSLVADHMESDVGCLVIEPHGDLIEDILRLVPKSREKDVVLLDFGDEPYAPGFDLFDGKHLATAVEQQQYIDKIVGAFAKTLGKDSWGPRLENMLRCIAITFMNNPGTTMAEMELLLTNEEFRATCVRNVRSNGIAWRFWEQFERMKGKDAYIESTLTKIRAFLFNPMLAAIVGQPGKSIDFVQAIRNRQIVLIALPEATLGEGGVDLLGTLYLSRMRAAVHVQMTLPEERRTPFFVYLDEFQRFASGDISQFLAESRKAKIGLTMAHQWRSQIEDLGVRAAPLAAGNKFIFQVTPEDAAVFARDFQKAPLQGPAELPAIEPAKNLLTHLGKELGERCIDNSQQETKEFHAWNAPEEVRTSAISQAHEFMKYSSYLSGFYWRTPANYLYEKGSSSFLIFGRDVPFFTQRFDRYDSPHAVMWDELNRYFDAIERRNPRAQEIIEALPGKFIAKATENLERYWRMMWNNPPRYPYTQAIEEGYRREGASRPTQQELNNEWEMVKFQAYLLGQLLERYPICTVESARAYQHAVSVASKPPTREQIAGALTHLPRYHCHGKLSQGTRSVEVTLETTQIGFDGDAADREAIRGRSRLAYTMPMDEAIADMNARQDRYWKDTDLLLVADEPPRRGAID